MMFPEKMTNIRKSDLVLEVGPGGYGHPRADVLLEKDFGCETTARAHRSYSDPVVPNKKLIFYDGGVFPFKDKEFDYVICSQVLEHVPDVDEFVRELVRVSRRGYVEYPTVYYDYIYNIPAHENFLKKQGDALYWIKKSETPFEYFCPVTRLFWEGLGKRYTGAIKDFKEYMFEGFEWEGGLATCHTNDIENLVYKDLVLPAKIRKKGLARFIDRLFKR